MSPKKTDTPQVVIEKFLIVRLDGDRGLLGIYKTKEKEKEGEYRIPKWINDALPRRSLQDYGIQCFSRARSSNNVCLDWVKMEVDNPKEFEKKFPENKITSLEDLFGRTKKQLDDQGIVTLSFPKRKQAIAALEVMQLKGFGPRPLNFHGTRKKEDLHQIQVDFDNPSYLPFGTLIEQINWAPKSPNLEATRGEGAVAQRIQPPLSEEKYCFATYPKNQHRDLAPMVRWLKLLTDINITAEKGVISYPRDCVASLQKIFPNAGIPKPPAIQHELF